MGRRWLHDDGIWVMIRTEANSSPSWTEVKIFFDSERTEDLDRRDIFIANCSKETWIEILEWLDQSPYQVQFMSDGKPCAFNSVAEIFQAKESSTVILYLDLDRFAVRTLFLHEDQVEFDFSASEIQDQTSLDKLLSFVGDLSKLTGKEVIVSYSSEPEGADWIFKVDSFALVRGEDRVVNSS